MHEDIKLVLRQLTLKDLHNISDVNELQLSNQDLMILHHLLTNHWDQIINESSLTLKETALTSYASPDIILKYREIITLIKRDIVLKESF